MLTGGKVLHHRIVPLRVHRSLGVGSYPAELQHYCNTTAIRLQHATNATTLPLQYHCNTTTTALQYQNNTTRQLQYNYNTTTIQLQYNYNTTTIQLHHKHDTNTTMHQKDSDAASTHLQHPNTTPTTTPSTTVDNFPLTPHRTSACPLRCICAVGPSKHTEGIRLARSALSGTCPCIRAIKLRLSDHLLKLIIRNPRHPPVVGRQPLAVGQPQPSSNRPSAAIGHRPSVTTGTLMAPHVTASLTTTAGDTRRTWGGGGYSIHESRLSQHRSWTRPQLQRPQQRADPLPPNYNRTACP